MAWAGDKGHVCAVIRRCPAASRPGLEGGAGANLRLISTPSVSNFSLPLHNEGVLGDMQ